MSDDSAECLILRYLHGQELACGLVALGIRMPRPQDDAVRIGIARGDPLGIEITPLMPVDPRTSSRSGPGERSTDCGCGFEKGPTADRHRLTPSGLQFGVTPGSGRQRPPGQVRTQRPHAASSVLASITRPRTA